MALIERANVLQIPAGTEGAAFAIQHGDARRIIRIELKKCAGQRIRAFRIHGVAGLGTVVNNSPDRSALFDFDSHAGSLPRLSLTR